MLIKNLIKGIALLPVMLLMTGCLSKLSVDDSIDYMEKKYNLSFELAPDDHASSSLSSMKFFVTTPSLGDKRIAVWEEIINDEKVFHDNFMAHYYYDETLDLINSFADKCFGSHMTIYEIGYNRFIPDEFNLNTTFAEFRSSRQSKIYASIILPESYPDTDLSGDMQAFGNLCASNKFCGVFDIYYSNDDSISDNFKDSPDMYNSGKWYRANTQVTINDDFSVIEFFH